MNLQTITLGDAEIRILSTVKGLVSESKIIEKEIDSFNPDLVALGMGPEEVNGTREWDGEPYDMSGWDEIYGLSLRKIVGDKGVKLPPPSFSTAIKISDSKEISVIGIDMDEVSFTEAYTKNISTWQLFKRGRLEKSMLKAGIEGKTPEEIALNMESSIRQLSGFATLEMERVKTMANNLHAQSKTCKKILAIIEISNVLELIDALK
tara:strand:- start:2862 stop:3482 length:621 start_codon:yes stop_codon:yes gene_type:complete